VFEKMEGTHVMISQLAPALLALLIALILGGSLRGLAQPIALWPIGLAAVLVELVLGRISSVDQPWVLVWGHWIWTSTIVAG
jgi:hypothetical protein